MQVALFNIMLDKYQSGEEWNDFDLEYDVENENMWAEMDIFPQLKGLGVGLVCCQKVIGHGVREKLEREGIQVVERLGTAGYDRMVRISGAKSVSSIHYRYD